MPKHIQQEQTLNFLTVLVPFSFYVCVSAVLVFCMSFTFLLMLFPARPKDKAGALIRTRGTDASNTKGS